MANSIEPDPALRQRLLLIGDAGWPRDPEPVLQCLTETATKDRAKTRIIFLGDNIYLDGMPLASGQGRAVAQGRLNPQLQVIRGSGAKGTFIPGNHEYRKNHDPQAEADYIRQELPGRADYQPAPSKCGNLGPAVTCLPGVRLIFFDSALLLQEIKKTGNADSGSGERVARFTGQLRELLRSADDRAVIVLAHHPPATHGQHGGFYDIRDHLFPLTRFPQTYWAWIPMPLIGSAYPIFRSTRDDAQDVRSSAYQTMNKELLSVLQEKPPLAFAAGHEHDLQVLEGGKAAKYILVSGAGSKTMLTTATHHSDTLFSHLHPGFMALDFMKNGTVLLRIVEPGDKPGASTVTYSKWLK